MARQVQLIRGTTEQNDNFTGATGALSYDTDTKGLRIHDGSTQGGIEVPTAAMADYVIYWDSADSTDHSHAKPGVSTPTDHGWYRYYKSGWVEQGGHNDGENNQGTNTFAIEMADLNYSISLGRHVISGTAADQAAISFQAHSCTTTGFTCAQTYAIVGGGGGYGTGPSYAYDWVVRGRAA